MQALQSQRLLAKEKLTQANTLKNEDKLEEAISLYSEALELVPDFIPALTQLSAIYTKSKQWEQVVNCCQRIIVSQPEHMGTHLKLAQALKQQGDVSGAIAAYKKEIAIDPKQPVRVYLELADLLGTQNLLDEQIDIYCQAIQLQPSFPKTHRQLAAAIVKQGKIKNLAKIGQISETITFYRKLLDLPSFLESQIANIKKLHQDLGGLIIQQSVRFQKFDEAVAFFQEASSAQANNPWYPYYLGKCVENQGETDRALLYYEEAIKLRPDFVAAYMAIGENLRSQGEYDSAFKRYLKALQIQPNNLLINTSIWAFFNRPDNRCDLQKMQEQLQAYQNIIDKTSDMASFGQRFRYAQILIGSGKVNKGIEENQNLLFERLQRSKPDYVKTYWHQGKLSSPDFFMIGVMKCGTTALYDYIVQHPKILPALIKEARGIGCAQNPEKFDNNIKAYLSLFSPRLDSKEFIAGEASTGYFRSNSASTNIRQHFPQAKLMVILRNPVKRLISQYFFQIRGGRAKLPSFEEIVNSELQAMENLNWKNSINLDELRQAKSQFLIHGLYVYFLEYWMSLFPKEQFLILRNEDLSKNPASVMSKVFEFLGVPDYQQIEYPRRNTTAYPSQIDESLLTRLNDFYRPHNQRLEEFLGQKFDWD